MTPELEHERCSELLLDFVEGNAGEEDRALVEAHLATCERCAAEHGALIQLIGPVDPLTPAESEAMRAAIARELRPEKSETVIPLRAPRSRMERYARWVAAAALILGGVVFGRSLFLSGEDSPLSGTAESGAGGAAQDAAETADVSERLLFRRPQFRPEAAALGAQEESADQDTGGAVADRQRKNEQRKRGTTGGGAGAGTTDSYGYSGPPRPLYVRGAGTLSERKLTLIGRYGLPLVLFSRAYTAADADRSRELFLAQLANAAENDARAEQIVDCGAQVLDRDTPTLPALATFGRYQDAEVLVLAFAWSPKPNGRLNRYMVWTWPANDCNAVPSYRAGTIGV